jgi:hypothetical protein
MLGLQRHPIKNFHWVMGFAATAEGNTPRY